MCATEPGYYLVLDMVSHTTMRVRGRRSMGTFPDLEKGRVGRWEGWEIKHLKPLSHHPSPKRGILM